MEPGEPSPVHDDQPHLPPPTLWPLGFAIGIAVVLVGLIVNPEVVSSIGGAISIVFGYLWVRDATAELRGHPIVVEPESRELRPAGTADAPPLPAPEGGDAMPPPEPGERFPRSRFLEGATLGIGGVITGVVTLPVLGFAVLPAFLDQPSERVDMGPLGEYDEGQWYIAKYLSDPKEGYASRRSAFVRNNGLLQGKPSFTLILNRCAHLGCPIQPNGPMLGKPKTLHGKNGAIDLTPVQPAGFGCPCHGGQYDTEGNRTAGPPTHALDRFNYAILDGRLWLQSLYSVSHVDGQGAAAKIHKYRYAGPGQHLDGPEQWLYPLEPPHH